VKLSRQIQTPQSPGSYLSSDLKLNCFFPKSRAQVNNYHYIEIWLWSWLQVD